MKSVRFLATLGREVGTFYNGERFFVFLKPEVGTNHQPEVGTNDQPEVGTNHQPEVGTNDEHFRPEAAIILHIFSGREIENTHVL